MYTREEFEQLRMEAAQEMAGDRRLAREANGVPCNLKDTWLVLSR
jgi:hypothetical protein